MTSALGAYWETAVRSMQLAQDVSGHVVPEIGYDTYAQMLRNVSSACLTNGIRRCRAVHRRGLGP